MSGVGAVSGGGGGCSGGDIRHAERQSKEGNKRQMSKRLVLLMVGVVVEMIRTPKDEASKENEQEMDEWSWRW